jgi:hypothetical protein
MKALRFDKETTKDVARLVELHLRFHGYGEGAWTDSAVRRYVTDAGPLLPRLHRLTRSDSTTRNRRKAQRLRLAYDDLERRIEVLQEQEELAAVRPDLDGTAIMASCSAWRRDPSSAGRTSTCSPCGWTPGRWTPRPPRRSCAAGGPSSPSRRGPDPILTWPASVLRSARTDGARIRSKGPS